MFVWSGGKNLPAWPQKNATFYHAFSSGHFCYNFVWPLTLGDARILGSGDFVANVMKDANEVLDQTAKFDISLDELIFRVCAKFEIRVKNLVSKSRKRYLSQARGVVCYLAVDELPCPVKLTTVTARCISLGGHSGDDVARSLRISGRGVSDCRERGKALDCDTELEYNLCLGMCIIR